MRGPLATTGLDMKLWEAGGSIVGLVLFMATPSFCITFEDSHNGLVFFAGPRLFWIVFKESPMESTPTAGFALDVRCSPELPVEESGGTVLFFACLRSYRDTRRTTTVFGVPETRHTHTYSQITLNWRLGLVVWI